MKQANYAPIYCALYPELAEIARAHGYALSIHGSLARDFDLICVPWADYVTDPEMVVEAFTNKFAIKRVGEMTLGNHGRMIYTLSISFGECFIDLSFTPANVYSKKEPDPVQTPIEDELIKGSDRYQVEKNTSVFWPYHVRAGNGDRLLFVGGKASCENVAKELATAFEDGKFVQKNGITSE